MQGVELDVCQDLPGSKITQFHPLTLQDGKQDGRNVETKTIAQKAEFQKMDKDLPTGKSFSNLFPHHPVGKDRGVMSLQYPIITLASFSVYAPPSLSLLICNLVNVLDL